MKRYWIFYFEVYYPFGGMQDFKGSFDTLEEATKALRVKARANGCENSIWNIDQGHVLDSTLETIVWTSDHGEDSDDYFEGMFKL